MSVAVSAEKPGAVRQHVAYLDGLRALAALYVILHHCFLQERFGGAHLSKWAAQGVKLLGFGHYAVDVFIVLSGFCLALPVVRGDGSLAGGALGFFKKRARRILPPYFFALAFSLLLIRLLIGRTTGTHWDVSLPVTRAALITHLFLAQDLFKQTDFKINDAFWSISVEWRIYFLFPLLMALRRRVGALVVAAGCTVAGYVVLYVGQHTALNSIFNFGFDGITPQYLGLFAVGMLGADIAYGKTALLPTLRRPSPALALLGATTLLMLGVSRVSSWHGGFLPDAYADFFVGLWAASLMVAAANAGDGRLNRLLSSRPLVFIGTFAYSIYLIHGPLIQVIWQYVLFPLRNNPLHMFLGLSLVGTPLILGTAYLFFLACERPFLTRRKRQTLAETERDAALSPAP